MRASSLLFRSGERCVHTLHSIARPSATSAPPGHTAWVVARALATGGPPRGTAVGTRVDDVRQVIAVASGKGGVGKSTTAGAALPEPYAWGLHTFVHAVWTARVSG
jgi:hypothetical protein